MSAEVLGLLMGLTFTAYFCIGFMLTLVRFIDSSPRSEVDLLLIILKAAAFWAVWPVAVAISARRRRRAIPKATARFAP